MQNRNLLDHGPLEGLHGHDAAGHDIGDDTVLPFAAGPRFLAQVLKHAAASCISGDDLTTGLPAQHLGLNLARLPVQHIDLL